VGQDCQRIPPLLAQLYGTRVQSLDLSYNCITNLKGLEKFPNLHTLVLDNNNLSDTMQLPNMPNLHTLSLNKNNVNRFSEVLSEICNYSM
jgi:Leucine-rich repeat (LRR) protein